MYIIMVLWQIFEFFPTYQPFTTVAIVCSRCVVRVLMSAPLGYHVSVYSPVPLAMVKEDEVWSLLSKVTCTCTCVIMFDLLTVLFVCLFYSYKNGKKYKVFEWMYTYMQIIH